MKDWLNDKKNLPIIIAITVVVVLAALALVYLTMFKGSGGAEETAPTAADSTGYPSAPDSPGGAPPAPGGPSAPSTMQPQTGQLEASPPTQESDAGSNGQKKAALLPSRPDPFLPLDYKPPKRAVKPRIVLPPIGILGVPKAIDQRAQTAPTEEVLPPQPSRRMAGILYNSKIHAILETNGEAIVVKPGDIVENGNVRVDSIEPNRIILSWLRTKKPLPIEVRMSETPTGETDFGSSSGTGELGPGAPSTPRMPGLPPAPRFGGSGRRTPGSPYAGYPNVE